MHQSGFRHGICILKFGTWNFLKCVVLSCIEYIMTIRNNYSWNQWNSWKKDLQIQVSSIPIPNFIFIHNFPFNNGKYVPCCTFLIGVNGIGFQQLIVAVNLYPGFRF